MSRKRMRSNPSRITSQIDATTDDAIAGVKSETLTSSSPPLPAALHCNLLWPDPPATVAEHGQATTHVPLECVQMGCPPMPYLQVAYLQVAYLQMACPQMGVTRIAHVPLEGVPIGRFQTSDETASEGRGRPSTLTSRSSDEGDDQCERGTSPAVMLGELRACYLAQRHSIKFLIP
ncbi:MAG: hypothetical protein FRX48_01002 [Lasallia pustulata]|uniref:Uncharacterized protein n=1 Tax=Lasallia pustulata TaxID=136370 RepID=A0A5M8Q3M3_9LECA|nr:MAG: hypothetical protein FRX48_01002 [Lasallia pustulata]